MDLLQIKNHKNIIMWTNYWQLPQGQDFYYLSFNANTARLLTPVNRQQDFLEVCNGSVKEVFITPYSDVIELLFEDNTDTPFQITLDTKMVDRKITKGSFELLMYGHSHEKIDLPVVRGTFTAHVK